MPELPEVETVVRGLRPRVEGRTIAGVPYASPLMAVSKVGPFAECLPGRSVVALDRHGKWMFFRLDNGWTLVIHLGMSGRIHWADGSASPPPHTHCQITFQTPDGRLTDEMWFTDPRRFGELLLYDAAAMDERFGPHQLGPEATTVGRKALATALAKTRRPTKSALLDQRVVAGVGNIYADEILFAAGIAPHRPANSLSPDEMAVIHSCLRQVLKRAIKANGTTIRDYITVTGVPGEFQKRLNVYGRADQPCKKCRGPIRLDRKIVTGRATCWCPTCQH